jgi:hypothetical protein
MVDFKYFRQKGKNFIRFSRSSILVNGILPTNIPVSDQAAVVKNNFENKSPQINKSYFEDENSFQNNGKEVTNINTNKSLEKQNNFTIKTGLGKEIQFSKVKKSLNYEVKQLSNSNSKSIENLLNFNNFENPKMNLENINISIEEVR